MISAAPNLDVHIIPDAAADPNYRARTRRPPEGITTPDIVKSALILVAATVIGFAFDMLGFTEANIIAICIFGVLLISTVTNNRLCSLVSTVISVLLFNFFFTLE